MDYKNWLVNLQRVKDKKEKIEAIKARAHEKAVRNLFLMLMSPEVEPPISKEEADEYMDVKTENIVNLGYILAHTIESYYGIEDPNRRKGIFYQLAAQLDKGDREFLFSVMLRKVDVGLKPSDLHEVWPKLFPAPEEGEAEAESETEDKPEVKEEKTEAKPKRKRGRPRKKKAEEA